MEQYNVTGMSCAACSARVEKAVNSVPGVTSCSVSLLTNSMGVEGNASASDIIKAVTDAGYGASLKEKSNALNKKINYDEELKDTETPKLRNRFIASVILLIPLMYVSMGHMLFNWPLPAFLNGNHVAMGIYELLLTVIIMVINQKFFISGFKGLIHKAPNMDTLVALGATASFSYSVFALFEMTASVVARNEARTMKLMDEFYFESAATILTLITVGKMLEAISKGKTTNALKSLMKLAPKTATIIVGGIEKEIPIEEVNVSDIFVIKPGESIPVDGLIIEGSSAVNEAALTGESIPVDKVPGDQVSAATINQSGYLKCRATKVGEDTTLSQIIQMVSNAAATKAPIAKIADRVSGVFVPTVIGIAIVTFIIWLLAGQSFSYALSRAISVLVISCPCALGLATPVAIMVGNGLGAKNGIMFKTAVSLEETGKAQIVVLDKTGTITKGEPSVTNIITDSDVTLNELLTYAYSLEIKSEHPLAKAIVKTALDNSINAMEITGFKAEAGNGLSALINGQKIVGGNYKYISKFISVPDDYYNKATTLADNGETPLFFGYADKFLGIISVADVIKEDSAKAIDELKDMGIHTVMLTGDNPNTAKAIGDLAHVDKVIAGVLPDGKEAVIKKLQGYGKVIMVGDGINDAPALTRADIGIAIGAGTDIAIDAADIVVVKNSIRDVAAAIRLSRATLTNIHENLFWAFFYNIIGIPLAAGLYIPLFGWTLNPMFGAAAMSLSSFCVVTNALRLNTFKLYNNRKAKKAALLEIEYEELKENKTMEIEVKGMMCEHCEAHVKKALEKIEGIVEATANHNTNSVVINTNSDVSEDAIKAAVLDAGYEYVGLK